MSTVTTQHDKYEERHHPGQPNQVSQTEEEFSQSQDHSQEGYGFASAGFGQQRPSAQHLPPQESESDQSYHAYPSHKQYQYQEYQPSAKLQNYMVEVDQ